MENQRRRRALEYFQKKYGGNRARIMDKTKLSKGRIAQIYDEAQPFGELAARNLAIKLTLIADYFESDRGEPVPAAPTPDFSDRRVVSESEWSMLEDIKAMPEEERDALRADLRAKAEKFRAFEREVLERFRRRKEDS